MIFYRCFSWDERAPDTEPGGALWFPRELQGEGRHDNPELYGCLYVTSRQSSAVVEKLASFRSQRFIPEFLRRRGLPLALAAIELPDAVEIVDLDDPSVLSANELRPSLVATLHREVTQQHARELHGRYPTSGGLQWWSRFESTWMNFTIFDRVRERLRLDEVVPLEPDSEPVVDATEFLGMMRAV